MKFGENLFPKGTFPGQQTDGAYIDETLAQNLNVYAEKIAKDMHFFGLITGHDSVGNGKSTLATHVGCYLTNKINELHGVNNSFTNKNIAFKGQELADISFKLPPLSVILLDEGDDMTTHGMKELAVRLKRYFRKCRQLNQILIVILPSFFEFPKFYSLNRSHFLIDVQFEGKFERGFFSFYGPDSKKKLYLRGKKEWDYSVQKPDFRGRFFASYCFFPDCQAEIDKYLKRKRSDMVDDNEEHEIKSEHEIRRMVRNEYYLKVRKFFKEKTQREVCDAFEISVKTGHRIENGPLSIENGQNQEISLEE